MKRPPWGVREGVVVVGGVGRVREWITSLSAPLSHLYSVFPFPSIATSQFFFPLLPRKCDAERSSSSGRVELSFRLAGSSTPSPTPPFLAGGNRGDAEQ